MTKMECVGRGVYKLGDVREIGKICGITLSYKDGDKRKNKTKEKICKEIFEN
jgi:4-aminobutyrate aminotransferase-like enzyme